MSKKLKVFHCGRKECEYKISIENIDNKICGQIVWVGFTGCTETCAMTLKYIGKVAKKNV